MTLTWTDSVTGREWFIEGNVGLEWPPSPRQILKDTLDVFFAPGVYVVDHPPETVIPPAIVIRPADPYQAPYTAHGVVGSAYAFEVDVIVSRNLPSEGLDDLERFRELICQNLPAGWRWLEFGGIGEITVAEKTYLKGTLGLAVPVVEGLDQYKE